MQPMEITISTILALAGGVSVIGTAGAVIFKWIRPAFNLTKKVADLERKSVDDYKLLTELNEMNKAQSLAIISLINHEIDGNGVDKMKAERDKLLNALAERKY